MSQLFFFLSGPFLKPAAAGHIDFTANDRFNTLCHAFFVQVHCSVHDSVIRNGYGSLPHFLHMRHQLLNPAGAVKKTIFRMHMEMNKRIHSISPSFFEILFSIVPYRTGL